MTQEDRKLLAKAIEYVNRHYLSDCPYYVQLVFNRFNELKENL